MQYETKSDRYACIIAYTFYEVDFRVSRYADALVDAGYHVDVFALRRKDQARSEQVKGATVHHLQERDYNEKGLLSFLVKMLLFGVKVFIAVLLKQFQYRYDVVHVHNPPDFLVYAAIIPKMLGAKLIFDMHENLPEFYCTKFGEQSDAVLVKILLLFEKLAVQFADYTIVAHDLLRERVMKRDKVEESRCIALLNYPSKSNLKSSVKRRNENEFKIIYPGTISYLHGVDIAIRAMDIVKKRCENIKLHVYGRSNNQAYYQTIMTLISDLDLGDTVFLNSVVPYEEIRNIMSTACLGVVPKRGGIFGSEAFSTKVLEFMAESLPVVMSRTKIDEYYFDDTMVKYFEPENHMDLARCILELSTDPQRMESLAKRGSEFIESNNWEIKSRQYLDIVNMLSGNGKHEQRSMSG